jgi:hypothetical protein
MSRNIAKLLNEINMKLTIHKLCKILPAKKTLETMVKADSLPAESAASIERYVDERAILMAMGR